MKNREYSCIKLCFPLNSKEVERSLKGGLSRDSLLFVCMDLEAVSICIKEQLHFIQLKDLIPLEEFNSVSVNEALLKWRDEIGSQECDILETDYKFVFNYHISHVIRAVKLADLLFQSVIDKIDFYETEFYSNNWPRAYSRLNISLFIRQLVLISFGPSKFSNISKLKLRIHKIFWTILRLNGKLLVLLEFFIYSLGPASILNWRKLGKSSEIKRVLFFSGGRDLRFHSLLSKYLGNYSLIALKGKSQWNDKHVPEHRFEIFLEFFPLLFRSYLYNSRVVNMSFRGRDFRCFLNSLASKNNGIYYDYMLLLEKYIGFKIDRDIMIIKSCCGIIDRVEADLVFTSSLPLPLISAKICNKVTMSEFEGFGIEMNPMAPYIGDYVSTPGPLSAEQLVRYKGGCGEILPVGAYYH